MNTEEKRELMAQLLAEFRKWSYEQLAAEIDRTRRAHDCLRHVAGVFADGTEYQLEFNVFWDDQPGGDLRVTGDLTAEPQRPWLGFVPIYTPDVCDDFILRPDGTFVDE
jgi:hypothetical protein